MEVRASLGGKRHSSPPPRRGRLPLPDRQSHKEDEVWAQSCCCAPRSPKRWTAHPRLGISWKGCCCSCPHDESACKYSLILHEGVRFLLRSSAVRARAPALIGAALPLCPSLPLRYREAGYLRFSINVASSLLLSCCKDGLQGGVGPCLPATPGPSLQLFFSAARAFHLAECFFFCHFLCVEPAPAPLSGVRTDMTDLLDHEPGEPKDEDSLAS